MCFLCFLKTQEVKGAAEYLERQRRELRESQRELRRQRSRLGEVQKREASSLAKALMPVVRRTRGWPQIREARFSPAWAERIFLLAAERDLLCVFRRAPLLCARLVNLLSRVW